MNPPAMPGRRQGAAPTRRLASRPLPARPPRPARLAPRPPPRAPAAASFDESASLEHGASGGSVDHDPDATAAAPPPPRRAPPPALAAAAARARGAATRALAALAEPAERAAAALDSPSARAVAHYAQFAASIGFVVLYVWSTYSAPLPGTARHAAESLLCAVFALEYLHRLAFKHPTLGSRLRMVSSPRNLADLLSWAPPLAEDLIQLAAPGFSFSRFLDLRWFKLLRSFRVLRVGLLGSELRQLHLSTARGGWLSAGGNFRLAQLSMSVAMLLFMATSAIQIVEQIPFHRALYFVATTLSTVGYGDVVATTLLGQAAVLAMIAVGLVLIPVQAAQFYAEVSARRVVRGALPAWAGGKPFVVLATRLTEVGGGW